MLFNAPDVVIILIVIIVVILVALNLRAIVTTAGVYGGAPSDDFVETLLTEWEQQKATKRAEKYIANLGNPYEGRNILERFLLEATAGYDRAINIHDEALANTAAQAKMMDEFIDKRIVNRDESDRVRVLILEQLKTKPVRDTANVTLNIIEREGKITCTCSGDAEPTKYTFDSTHRIQNMIKLAELKLSSGSTKMKDSETIHDMAMQLVTICRLRYDAVAEGSQNWGLPQAVFNKLYDEHGVRNEGFASPFNSRAVGSGYTDAKFCSAYIDTDKYFGSIGSFYEADLIGTAGNWCVNPPYVETMLKRTADHILESLSRADKLVIFVLLPAWADNVDIQRLIGVGTNERETKYFVALNRMKKNSHRIEEPNGNSFVARFGNYFAALAVGISSSERARIESTVRTIHGLS
jgi:hypothetical protein